MQNGSSMYYLALVIEGTLADEIQGFKEEMRQEFGCKAALKSPPHITLIPPFFWANGLRKILVDTFMQFESEIPRLELQLDGFGHFGTQVIYANPEHHPDLLVLYKDCQSFFKPLLAEKIRDKHAFHPHITIANRDLKAEDFAAAWSLFKQRSFKRMCTISEISLMQHNGSKWELADKKAWFK